MPPKDYFSCGDRNCDLCYDANGAPKAQTPGDVIDFESALRTLRSQSEEVLRKSAEQARLTREQKYMEYVNGLDQLDGAVRMFRTWRLYPDGTLRAMTQQHIWKKGENVTLADGGDASPDSGFYGFNGLTELREQEEDWWGASQSGEPRRESGRDSWGYPTYTGKPIYWYVCGTILAYGHVKVSELGGRCQKAIPEYIIEPDGSDPDFGMLVVNAAEMYGMGIVSVEQAAELKTGLVPFKKGERG